MRKKKTIKKSNERIDESDDESKIDWSGLGDVVTKRYYARLKKEGLPPEDEGDTIAEDFEALLCK